MQKFLPADLWNFLESGRQLEYDVSLVEPGRMRLQAAKDLRIGRIYAAALSKRDPNRKKSGVYRIPAISLVESCERYDPEYLLAYLPFEGMYAALDQDHARVTVFTSATWSDIVASPTAYLNSLWEESPSVSVSRDEHPWWSHYAFFEEAFE